VDINYWVKKITEVLNAAADDGYEIDNGEGWPPVLELNLVKDGDFADSIPAVRIYAPVSYDE